MKKKLLAGAVALGILLGCAACGAPTQTATGSPTPAQTPAPTAPAAGYTAGTYTATTPGMHGPLSVEVTVSEGSIDAVSVTDCVDTLGLRDWPMRLIPERVVEHQSLSVDTVTGATITSRAILRGVTECLTEAGGDLEKLKAALPEVKVEDVEATADIVIVGGGGAGMAAAVSATQNGASVILIEKSGFIGGNSIVSGGIYNTPDPKRQATATVSGDLESLVVAAISEEPVSEEHKALMDTVRAEFEAWKQTDLPLFDSPSWYALQTWNGGDKVAELNMVELMAANALSGLEWMESLGMEFASDVHHGGGSLYPRTHTAVMPGGTGYFDAYTRALEGQANYTQMMETTAESLIMDGDKVVGVNAVGKDGNKVTLHANKAVIMATGGFAGNVELREEYCEGEKWPDLGAGVPNTNMPAISGDGIFMARDAGANLVNMDQIQLLYVCNPQTGATYDLVMGHGSHIFVNKEGERFVREDGRRDEMSKAIIDQTDGLMYLILSADTVPDPAKARSVGGYTLDYFLENNLYNWVSAADLDELAQKLEIPADALKQSVADFNAHAETGDADAFGRVSYSGKLENGPWYAVPRKPAVHHTMGGVSIDESARALRADGTPIEGLYCAGEITGVLHGGNRVGGNAIVDFVVFGRIAGEHAAKS